MGKMISHKNIFASNSIIKNVLRSKKTTEFYIIYRVYSILVTMYCPIFWFFYSFMLAIGFILLFLKNYELRPRFSVINEKIYKISLCNNINDNQEPKTTTRNLKR